ncbi:MAG: hypothetical protein R2712_28550 [Vicinamibacterales bacterium]
MIDPETLLLMGQSQFAPAREASAPLGTVTEGHLAFTAGAAHLAVDGPAPPGVLFEARFGGPVADVRVANGHVGIGYRTHGRPATRADYDGRIRLSAEVPWTIACHYGAVRLRLDLSAVVLAGLRVEGGMSQVDITLPPPHGVVPVVLCGGVHRLTLRRPADVPIRLRLRGGAAHLAFERQRLGAVGGDTELVSSGFDPAAAGYDVSVTGGASQLAVE